MIRDGVLVQTSVSEVEAADHSQLGGCLRRWWFERANDLRPDQHRSQAEGEAGHALLAAYLSTGEKPKGRPLMGKAVTGAILKGELPTPGPDLLVERRFDDTDRPPAGERWPALSIADTFHLGGVPWDGFIDLAFRRGAVPEVWDHKFFTPVDSFIGPDPYANLRKRADLVRTVQLPVYVASQRPYWPDADRWRIVNHYVSKKGVDSRVVADVVTNEQVDERLVEIAAVVETMKAHAGATDQRDVTANLKSCTAWRGCPHQSICSAYRERTIVELTAEEAALFADLDSDTPAPAPAPVPAPAQAPAKAHRMPFHDEPAPAAPAPAPASQPAAPVPAPPAPTPTPEPAAPAASAPCACGETITAENGSRLQSGEWKHVGCPLTAPPPPPAKERRPRAPKAAQTPAPAPAPAPAAPPPAPAQNTAIAPASVEPAPPPPVTAPVHVPEIVRSLAPRGGDPFAARVALAETFEGIAKLLRSI